MLDDIKGYCLLKHNAQGRSPIELSHFQGKTCRAFEINHGSKSVLVIDPEAKGLGDFDLSECGCWFECRSFNGLLIPPDLGHIAQMEYIGRVFFHPQNLKRDMNFIRQMVILQSLAKGVFTDTLYFSFDLGS